jgi:hypothetical protein
VGGAVSRAQQRRPACAGTDRKGRVGGAVSGVGRWRPTGFGSDTPITNAATPAANTLTKSRTPIERELRGGQPARIRGPLLAPKVLWPHLLRPRGRSLPPARPAAWPYLQGRVGGNTSLKCNAGRQSALAATDAATKGQRMRLGHSSRGAWRLCRCTLAAGAHFFVQLPAVPVHLGCKHGACGASLSHPPAQRLGALGGGWAGNTSPNAAVTAGVLLQPEAQRQ